MKLKKTLVLCWLLSLPSPALAYVDPGTGMILFQSMVAGISVFLAAARSPRQFLKFLFQKFKNSFRRKEPFDE